jgi:hypothetical protein
MAKELVVSIRDDGEGNTKMCSEMSEKHICNSLSNDLFGARIYISIMEK